MKKMILITVSVALLVFTSFQWAVTKSTNNTTQYHYAVDSTLGEVEFRTYEQAVFAKVELNQSDFKTMSYSGFRVLAGYIFGNNVRKEKISMTSPVVMELEESPTMEFMMPSPYNLKDLPVPNDANITLFEKSSWKAAGVRFGGYADDKKIAGKMEELRDELEARGISHKGNFKFLGYNPPYQFFGRRNEVVVELY